MFGSTFADFLGQLHHDDRQRVGRAVTGAIEGGAPYEMEFRFVRPDGAIRWALAKGRVYYDRNGRAFRMSGIDIDITSRKEAEERLRRSEETFRASIDTLIDCFAIYTAVRDEQGRIIDFRTEYMNHPACLNNRLTRDEQVGRVLLELLLAHRESGLFARYCRVVETGEPLDIEEMFYEDLFGGERIGRVFAIRVSKLDDGYVAAWRDITDRKRAEVALNEGLNFARRIADVSPVDLSVYNLTKGRPVYQNHDVAAHLGFSAGEILAMGDAAVPTLMHPDDLVRFPGHLAGIARLADGETATFEFRMRDAGGEWHWFYSRDSVFARDADGRATQIIGAAVDITDRKRAEDARRISEERFRLAADAVSGLIYEWDVATDRVERTSGLMALTGFRSEEAEPFGDWWLQQVHPDDLGALIEGHRVSVARRERLREWEYRLLHRDGAYRHLWDRSVGVFDAEGRLARVVGFTVDVTAQRRAEVSLRETETRLRQLAESDIIGVVFGDVQGGISYANDEYLRILGYSREEFEANRIGWAAVTPPEWRAVDERAVAQAKSGGGSCSPYEKEYMRKDGGRIPVLVGFTLFGATETVAFILDISERKAAEREIRRLNQDLGRRAALLQTLFDVLPVGIGIAEDRSCRHIAGNPALARILRIPVGASASLTAPEGDRPATFKVYRDGKELGPKKLPMQLAAARGVESHNLELDVVYPDGSSLKLLEYVAPLLDEDGRPRGAVGAFLDITARTQVEAALKEADRRKDAFLAVLAHELKNPLATVSNAIRLLRTAGASDAERESAYDVADRQLQNIVRLVDDLLDISRISSGKIQLRTERLDVATVVARAVESVRPFIDARGQRLSASVAPGPMSIAGDSTRIEQVLANLLNNASKYSDDGGQITIGARPEGDEVVFRVSHTGIGIAPEMLSRVFEMFAQVDSSMNRSQGGLGIGLTLVRELTEMHGGRVSATSEGPGKGSEFTVSIPLLPEVEPPEMTADGGDGGEEPCQARSCRILLVDDNADTLWSMATLLGHSGYQVMTASDGPSALEAARGEHPEVIILDLGLPGMSGYEVADVLRNEGMTEAVLIAVSGYAQEEDRERSRRIGFDHHLSKPVDLDTLLGLIEGRGRRSW